MIGRLRGIILEKQPPLTLLETNGIGYEIYMPIICFYKLPDIGKETIIFVQSIIRKDIQLLYGFNNKNEQILFRELIKINGIGPKLALAILSGMSTQQFIDAVEHENPTELIKFTGIGKKTAKRLIIEMKDRFKDLDNNLSIQAADLVITTPATASINKTEQEAIAALVALGYKSQEANKMISKVVTPNASSETLVREALRATFVR